MAAKRGRRLRVGDKIRFVRLPRDAPPPPGWRVINDRETSRLYRALISDAQVLRVSEIDEHGCPWVWFTRRNRQGIMVLHGLTVTGDTWERVE